MSLAKITFGPGGEPHFINEEGIKWWICKTEKNYLIREPLTKIQQENLKPYSIWYVEFPDGEHAWLVLKGREPVAEYKQIDALALYLDTLRLTAEDE